MIVKLIVILTILSLEMNNIQTNELVSVLESKRNLIQKVNEHLHNAINQTFNLLNTMKYFAKPEHNKLLLKLHKDLVNITQRNFRTYFYVKNVTDTKYEFGLYPIKFLESITEIIKEELDKNNSNKNETIFRTSNDTVEQNSAQSNSVEESSEFLKDFLKTFEKLTVENFTNHESKEINKKTDDKRENTETPQLKLVWKSKTSELKVWNSSVMANLTGNNTRRLYQGKATKIKKYPFLVSVHIMNNFMCSGSIISKDLVITAASCLQVAYSHQDNPRSVFVRVGSDYTKSFGQLIPVTEIHFHPDYDPRTLRDNLAVIRIMKNLKLSNEKGRIRRIEYDKGTTPQRDGIYVLGWGAQEPKHNPSNFQKLAIDYLNIYGFEECKEVYSETYVTETNFCAGFANKGSGACNKDVGGPGFRNGILIGIVSFGPPTCGMTNSPTVFTQIGHYANWLDGLLRQREIERIPKPVEKSKANRPSKPSATVNTGPKKALRKDEDYPEEVLILKEMLQEILTTNTSLVDNILKPGVNRDSSHKASKVNTVRQQKDNKANRNKVNFNVKTYYDKNKSTTRTPKRVETEVIGDSTKADAIYSDNNAGELADLNDVGGKIPKKYVENSDFNEQDCDKEGPEIVDDSTVECNSGQDVSDNYEDKLNEIPIDTKNPVFRNVSFLDVVLNIEQYYQPVKKNISAMRQQNGVKDFIDIQLMIGTTQIGSVNSNGAVYSTLPSTRLDADEGKINKKILDYDYNIEEINEDNKLNFESDKEPLVTGIKNIIRTIPKVKEIYYRRMNKFN